MHNYWKRIFWLAGSILMLLPATWLCDVFEIVKVNNWCGLVFLVLGMSGAVLSGALFNQIIFGREGHKK